MTERGCYNHSLSDDCLVTKVSGTAEDSKQKIAKETKILICPDCENLRYLRFLLLICPYCGICDFIMNLHYRENSTAQPPS
jgi:hypothetical protein